MGQTAYANLFFGIPLPFDGYTTEEILGEEEGIELHDGFDENEFLCQFFDNDNHGVEFLTLGDGDTFAIVAKGYTVEADWSEPKVVNNRMFPGPDVHANIVRLYKFIQSQHPDEDFSATTEQPQHYLGALYF